MIKSSDSKFNNIYRIIKVLANRDYLAIDQQQNKFILSQQQSSHNPKERHPKIQINQSFHNDNILFSQEIIQIDDSKYEVFAIGKKQLVWAKEVDKSKLENYKFIHKTVTKAIQNILRDILWCDTNVVTKILHIKNFWMLNGQLSLLYMPRSNKEHIGLKRTEQTRSSSQESSTIFAIIEKQMKLIRQFAKIVWDIIDLPSLPHSSTENQWEIKKLLIKMMNKKLSFQEIMNQVKVIECSLPTQRINRSIYINSFEKKQPFARRHTLQNPFCTNFKQKRTTLVTPAKLKLKSKTQYAISYLSKDKYSGSGSQFHQTPMKNNKKKWYLNFKSKSVSVMQAEEYSSQKQNNLNIIKNIIKPKEQQQQKKKYLDWMKDKKMNLNIADKINHINQTAKQKFKENLQKNQPNNKTLLTEGQLKDRLFEKAIKFRTNKYQQKETQDKVDIQIQTESRIKSQSSATQTEEIKQQINPGINNNGIKISKRLFENQTQEPNNPFKKEPQNAVKEQKIRQQQTYFQNFRPNYLKQVQKKIQIQISNPTIVSNQISEPLAVSQNLQEVKFYEYFSNLPHKASQKHKDKHFSASVDVNKHIQTKNSPTSYEQIKKHPKINIAKSTDNEKSIDDQIQIIALSARKSSIQKPSPTTKQFEQKYSKKIQQQSTPICNIVKQKKSQNKSSEQTMTQNVKQISLAVKQFMTMINILGDISVQCVKSKEKLSKFEWRKSVFFIYERFFYERTNFLTNLQYNSYNIIRKCRQFDSLSFQAWFNSDEKKILTKQIASENANISTTYQQFSRKTLEQCKLQPMILNFIRNRNQLLEKKDKKIRFFISKYAVAEIINEFDKAVEREKVSEQVSNYISKCLFGLRIFAELDNIESDKEALIINDYAKPNRKLLEQSEEVEHLYSLYYPQWQEKPQTS